MDALKKPLSDKFYYVRGMCLCIGDTCLSEGAGQLVGAGGRGINKEVNCTKNHPIFVSVHNRGNNLDELEYKIGIYGK